MRQYLKGILVQNIWQQRVYFLEFHLEISTLKIWFVKIKFGLMLHTNHIRKRRNTKLDDNISYNLLAYKTIFPKT